MVYTGHSAVKAVLETPNLSAKLAYWWTKVYGSEVHNIHVLYYPSKENVNEGALSQNLQDRALDVFQLDEVQVAAIGESIAINKRPYGTIYV